MSTTTTEWPGAPITGRWFEEQGGLLAAGQGTLKRGQVLARGDDGKWRKYGGTKLAAADSDGNRGTARNAVAVAGGNNQQITFFLKHHSIVPGTLTIKSAADSDDSHVYSDDGRGRLSGVSADGQVGSVDYRSGLVTIDWLANAEADDILATFRYYPDGNDGVLGVLRSYEVDTAGANDKAAAIIVMGEVLFNRLIWPANTGPGAFTADEKARGEALLRERHIYDAPQ